MGRRRGRREKKMNIVVLLVCVLFVIGAVVIGTGIRAKYRTTEEITESVQFEADLAENVTLTEHSVTRKADGSYELGTAIETDGENEYEVMPGVDLPKDPTFTITNKSKIPAYLYVEVVESASFPGTVSYELRDKWTELTGATGQNGGKVYFYNETITESSPTSIPVVKDDKIIISQYYNSTGFELDFYGYMAQRIEGKTAKEVFAICFPTTP